jgi:hypothetical protein
LPGLRAARQIEKHMPVNHTTPCTAVARALQNSEEALAVALCAERNVGGLKWGQWAIGVLVTIVGIVSARNGATKATTADARMQSSATAEIVAMRERDSTREIALAAAQEGARIEHRRQAQYELDHPAPIAEPKAFKRVK